MQPTPSSLGQRYLAPARVCELENLSNLAALLHDRLRAAPLDAEGVRPIVADVLALAGSVEKYAAGKDRRDEFDDWTFERSPLIARDLWHAAAEFDFEANAVEEHRAGLLFGLDELSRSLDDELGPGLNADASSLSSCIADLTAALEYLHCASITDEGRVLDLATACLSSLARRLLGLSSCGLGLGGRDTRRAVLDLIVSLHEQPPGAVAPSHSLFCAAAVVLGHLHALQALVAVGGPAPLIFETARQETPDAPV